jgi:hypothetical protein
MLAFVQDLGFFLLFLDHRAPYATLPVLHLHFASTQHRLGLYAYMSIGGLRDVDTCGSHMAVTYESLTGGPDLPEDPTTCKWALRPYPQPRRFRTT